MKDIFEYMFYKFYRYGLFMHSANTDAVVASNLLGGVVFIYCLSIILTIFKLFNKPSFHPLFVFLAVVIIGCLIFYYNLKYFEKNDRHIHIIHKYSYQEKVSKIKGTLLVLLFSLGGFFLLFFAISCFNSQ